MSISEVFAAREEAIVFPDRSDFSDRADYTAARQAYDQGLRELMAEFQDNLAQEYLAEVDEAHIDELSGLVYRLAYEHGHGTGYSNIEYYYDDFAAIVLAGYRLASR